MVLKSKLTDKANIFTAIIIAIQPVLDIISFWFDKFSISSNFTLALRLAVLALTVLYAYIVSDGKWLYWVAFGVIALLYAGHFFAIWEAGIVNLIADFSNYVRVVQMPVCAICLITLMRRNKKSFDGLRLGMAIALIIILAVMIISTLTGTDPHTYKDGTGILGWFYNTNSQSSNLCVLLPITIVWQLTWKKRNPILLFITAILGFFAMFFFCTRLAYLGIIAISFGLGLMLLILHKKDWKYSICALLICVIFVAMIPISPMVLHQTSYQATQEERQNDLSGKIHDASDPQNETTKKPASTSKNDTEGNKDTNSEQQSTKPSNEIIIETTSNTKKIAQLKPIYEFYIGDFVQIFGLVETMEMYNYTTDINEFSDLRHKKLLYAEAMMEASPPSARMFGVEISRFSQVVVNSIGETVTSIYDVENDFHGIYYLYGWAGLVAYLLFIIYFLYLIICALLKSFKQYFTIEAVSFGIALVLCLIHAYNTAGVLRRPNASIYLSATLAGIYYLIKIKEYPVENIKE